MNRTKSKVLLLPVLALVLLLAACLAGRDKGAAEGDEVVLRTYEVPEGFDAETLSGYLRSSLSTGGETRLGAVRAYPDGSLVVTAPPAIQQGVRELLDSLASRDPSRRPPAPTPVTVSYWALLARPVPDGVRVSSPMLRGQPIRPVLDQIAEVDGPLEFTLLEKLRLTSVSGERSELRGRRLQVEQQLAAVGADVPLADVRIRMSGSRGVRHDTTTRVRLDPGRMTVLAQTAYDPDMGVPNNWDPSEVLLYYVISAE